MRERRENEPGFYERVKRLNRESYERNKEARRAYAVNYRAAHLERHKENTRRWIANNPERRRELQRKAALKYKTTRPLATLWRGIKQRCYNPKSLSYSRYGARGITMHRPWADSYLAFEASIHAECGTRPSPKHSLDRIDNNAGYVPGNLRWATAAEQVNNTQQKIALREREDIFRRLAHMEALIDDALSFDRAALAQAA